MPRGFPFMEAEKNYIIGLVIKYKDAIENKKLDKDTIERKRSAWDKITKEYNANERHMPRNVEQLRKLWENIKCRRRSEAAKEKRNILNARYSSSSEMQSDLKICGMDIKLENASYCDPLQLTENNTNEQNTINDILDSEGIRSETGTSFVINLDSGEDEERSSELFSVPKNMTENSCQSGIEVKLETECFQKVLIKEEIEIAPDVEDDGLDPNIIESDCKGFKTEKNSIPIKSCSSELQDLSHCCDPSKVLDEDTFEIFDKPLSETLSIESTIACDVCGKCFKHNRALKKHLLIHKYDRIFECEICSKPFPSKANLKRHMAVHTSDHPFQCKICSKSFSFKFSLNKHMNTHNGSRVQFQCEFCKKFFSEERYLKRHVLTHSDVRPFKCDICSKSFAYKEALLRHTSSHTNGRLFECDVCNKSFTLKSSLNNHMVKHTGERPYRCELCEMTFSYSSSLKCHIITHNSDLMYQCEFCKKSFSHKYNLSRHVLTHTAQAREQFSCEICSRPFTEKKNLNRHMLLHLSGNSFECKLCHETFSFKRLLSEHLTTHYANSI
ncbi:hypothetical protein C0J52_11188 [Blattella germanica]|nr:hypothetical protein C0J52_11188 [Blattella germanica]